MSKLWYVRLFFISVFAIANCASIHGADVVNRSLNFQITFPDSWHLADQLIGRIKVKGSSPLNANAKSVATVNVVVGEIDERLPLKSFVNSDTMPFKQTFKNYELAEMSEIKLSGVDTYKVTFSLDNEKTKDRVKCIIYYLIDAKYCYTITTAANLSDYKLYDEEITTIVNSFKLVK